MARRRSADELREAFEVQKSALLSSCRSYDEGQKWESLRLATAIYILVRDGGKKNKSILTQMGVKDSLTFATPILRSADPRNTLAYMPLVILKMSGEESGFVPRFDEFSSGKRMLLFNEWWERDLVFRSGGNQHRITRKKLVFNLRNLDGGSHYDEEILDPNYNELTHGNTPTFVAADGTRTPIRYIGLVTMRQIAWELLGSLERAGV